jgi:hypothetical protein
MSETTINTTRLGGATEFDLALENPDGTYYEGRITGWRIAEGSHDVAVYLTDDERVIIHDAGNLKHWESSNYAEDLRRELDDDAYIEAMHSLGESAVIEI